MEAGKEIEIRSEEVQEVMGQVPAWIVRWGVTVMFAVVLALLVGSYFFKYPDVIATEMTLTSREPVVKVVARSSGKISGLYVFNGQDVKMDALLGVVENPARTEDVLRLKKLLARYMEEPERLSYYLLQDVWLLGDIQPAYMSLASKDVSARDYRASVGQLLAGDPCLGDVVLPGGAIGTDGCSCLFRKLRISIYRRVMYLRVLYPMKGRPG